VAWRGIKHPTAIRRAYNGWAGLLTLLFHLAPAQRSGSVDGFYRNPSSRVRLKMCLFEAPTYFLDKSFSFANIKP
jgi:hypothetical protein